MGATLDQLARGLHGAVTREDAKKLAKLHGHSWKALLKAMKRYRPTPLQAAQRRIERLYGDPEMSLAPSSTELMGEINRATSGVEVRRGG